MAVDRTHTELTRIAEQDLMWTRILPKYGAPSLPLASTDKDGSLQRAKLLLVLEQGRRTALYLGLGVLSGPKEPEKQ